MATWLKLNADLLHKPDFAVLCSRLDFSEGEALIALFKTAAWFETHGHYGKVPGTVGMIDQVTRVSGLGEQLVETGWLETLNGSLVLKGFSAPCATRKSLGAKVRAEVLSVGECAACGSPDELVIDHIIPVARGGSCEQSNLQALCAPCNRQKGKKLPEEWRTN